MGGLRNAPRPAPAGGSPLERCRGGNLPPVGFGYDDSRSIPPPIFFSVLWKRKWAVDGPKEKAAFCAAHAATGVSRIGSGKDCRSSAGSRRTLPISRPLSRACQLGGHRGGKSHGPCACPRCRSMVRQRQRLRSRWRLCRLTLDSRSRLRRATDVASPLRGDAAYPLRVRPVCLRPKCRRKRRLASDTRLRAQSFQQD